MTQKTQISLLILFLSLLYFLILEKENSYKLPNIPVLPTLDPILNETISQANVSLDFSLITESSLFLIELQNEYLGLWSENSAKFAVFLQGYQGKFHSYLSSLRALNGTLKEMEEIQIKLEKAMEKSMECKDSLKKNQSLFKTLLTNYRTFEGEIQRLEKEIDSIVNELIELDSRIVQTMRFSLEKMSVSDDQPDVNFQENNGLKPNLTKITAELIESLPALHTRKAQLQTEIEEKKTQISLKQTEFEKNSLLFSSLEERHQILEFDLLEYNVQQNLTRKHDEYELSIRVSASKSLASVLQKRVSVLNEIESLEEDLHRKSVISQEIEELKSDSKEIIRATSKLAENEGFENGFGDQGNIELELLEIKQQMLQQNQKIQAAAKEIEYSRMVLKELEAKLENVLSEIFEAERNIAYFNENLKNQENQKVAVIKKVEAKSVKVHKSNELEELKSRTQTLAREKLKIEAELRSQLELMKSESSKLDEKREKLAKIIEECRGMESNYRSLFRSYQIARDDFGVGYAQVQKNKVELENFVSRKGDSL